MTMQNGNQWGSMKTLEDYTKGDMHGVHYAVSIFFATAILWVLIQKMSEANPVWAISSMVATSDPAMKQAMLMLRARITNTLLGCVVGLVFIAIGGTKLITLPFAMAVTVLLSSYVVRIPTMWRQAPISAAFVIAASLQYQSREHGLMAGATRMGEVLFGCLVGIVVAWIVSVVWPLPDTAPAEPPANK
jgi:uncharacterized membrane protein YccC